eukprot:TRINITY_DN8800_c0_g1_i1.p1 TRINITY_DN8800_c0_g1~~TRINITY_DN8800_c0_g1_i1.p1  ORF type:complete len:251 (+),score=37.57 TRINITY_DN8800_c0_g1_i1:81-833(+)
MEFDIPLQKVLKEEISVFNRDVLLRLAPPNLDYLQVVIDGMGKASATAQGLGQVITTMSRLRASPDQHLYIFSKNQAVGGILKIGKKKLFVRNPRGSLVEMEPLCVLDFFVAPSWQRSGIGRALFDRMLADVVVEPWQLGYDRPSPKLIAFLRKHFGLSRYRPQENNFVVFDEIFERTASARPDHSSPRPPQLPGRTYTQGSVFDSPTVALAAADAHRTPPAASTPTWLPAHMQSPFALFPDDTQRKGRK